MIYLLHHLYEAAARDHPDQVAVREQDRTCTYAELDRVANRLANLLRSLGVQRGHRVGILMEKSLDAVISVCAVLKAGAAYVPLDTGSPAPRLGGVLNDCGVRVLLSTTRWAPVCAAVVAEGTPVHALVVVDSADPPSGIDPGRVRIVTRDGVARQDATAPDTRMIDRDLAYVLYTSGSTGRSKGVMLTHANGLAFVRWAVEEFGVAPGDRISCPAPLHFDLSVFDLFAAPAAGAMTVIVPSGSAMFPGEIRRHIERYGTTVWYSVPSVLALMALRGNLGEGACPTLRAVLFAGEVFAPRALRQLMRALPGATFYNLYGPTETNVCTCLRMPAPPDPDGPPPGIGTPIANVDVMIRRPDGSPAEPGEVGELCVRGATVMAGYWGDAEKTSQVMVVGPDEDRAPSSFYCTGDLAVQGANGSYRFLGRRDHRVKCRGYRVELGEVEATLCAHPAVTEAVTLAVPHAVFSNTLVACVVADARTGPDDLVAFCAGRLPPYMIPQRIAVRPTLPRTSTGKVDRQALATCFAQEAP